MDVIREDFQHTWMNARPSVLGFLTALTVLGTFMIDIEMPDGVSAWAPYSIAIVLALLWDGACAIVSVTAVALALTLIGLWIGPLGEFQTGAINRVIGGVTITGLGWICLYVDRARRKRFHSCEALAVSRQQLHSFVDEMNNTGVVLCDLRGRVTESNHGAQLLTGYTGDDMRGQSLYRVFPGKMDPMTRWGQICHWARHKGEVAREEVFRRRDGSWRLMQMVVKPLQNRFRGHHGYSIVMRDLAKSHSVITGSSSKRRSVSSVLKDNRAVLLYRCRFEPRRTLDYVDVKNAKSFDDPAGEFPLMEGQALDEWIHPLDRERTWNTIEEAVQAQRSYLLVYRLVGAGGKDRWVWDEGESSNTDDGHIVGLEGFLAAI